MTAAPMRWFRRRRWTPDNLRAFTIPVMIGDPIAERTTAAVQGAAVSMMQGRPGHNGTYRGGASVYDLERHAGYLKGSLIKLASRPIGASAPIGYASQSAYSARLPSPQTPIQVLGSALQHLRPQGGPG